MKMPEGYLRLKGSNTYSKCICPEILSILDLMKEMAEALELTLNHLSEMDDSLFEVNRKNEIEVLKKFKDWK